MRIRVLIRRCFHRAEGGDRPPVLGTHGSGAGVTFATPLLLGGGGEASIFLPLPDCFDLLAFRRLSCTRNIEMSRANSLTPHQSMGNGGRWEVRGVVSLFAIVYVLW